MFKKISVLAAVVLFSFAAGLETGVKMRSPLCPEPGVADAIHQTVGLCPPCPDDPAVAKRRAEQEAAMRQIGEQAKHMTAAEKKTIDNWYLLGAHAPEEKR